MSTVKAWWRKADERVLAFSRDIPRAIPEILISGAEGKVFFVLHRRWGDMF